MFGRRRSAWRHEFLAVVMLTTLLVAGLSFGFMTSAFADQAETQAETQEQTQADTSEEDVTPQVVVEDDGATASDSETASATVIPTAATSAATPSVQVATGVHFSQLAIYDGDTLVADLLAGDVPELTAGKEYYLRVNVAKDSASDSTWVSITIPWWANVGNVPGGSLWSQAGTEFVHTSLDKVLAFSASEGGTSSNKTNSGTVTYHIMTGSSDVTNAGFQMSFTPSRAFLNANDTQTYSSSAAQFAAAVGDMDGDSVGETRQSVSTTQVIIDGTGALMTYSANDVKPYVGLDESVRATAYVWLPVWSTNGSVTKVEFDLTYPTGAVIGEVSIWGRTATATTDPVDNGDGTTSVHYVVEDAAGWNVGSRALSAYVEFPSDKFEAVDADYTVTFKNFKASVYGDENNAPITGAPTLTYRMCYSDPAVSLTGVNWPARYDWYDNEGVDQNTMLAAGDLSSTGARDGVQTESYTLKITPADGLTVRAVTVPLYDDHASTIELNGTTYDLADVATTLHEVDSGDMTGYAVVSMPDGSSITSVVYEVGKLQSDYHSYARPDVDAPDNVENARLALWGSYDGKGTTTSLAEIWPTGTSSEVKSANLTSITTDTKRVSLWTRGGYYNATTYVVAGDDITVSAKIGVAPYIRAYGSTTAWVNDYAVYLVVPDGCSVKDVMIDGNHIKGEDITDTDQVGTKPTNGSRIWRFSAGENTTAIGKYNTDMPEEMFTVSYTLSTDPDMSPQTLYGSSILLIGQDEDAEATEYTWGSSAYNPYQINNSGTLVGFGGPIYVQERKAVELSNSMAVTKGGTPLNEELVYDSSDPVNTRAVVDQNFEATYSLEVSNLTGTTIKNARIFIPIPEKGVSLGEVFSPEGAYGVGLSATLAGELPDGWTVSYLKVHDGKTYATNQVPAASDYDVLDGPEGANMILLSSDGVLPAGYTQTFDFTLTADDSVMDSEAISTWKPVASYVLGSTTFYSSSLKPESIETTAGRLEGIVYNDVNDNGVMDTGEKGIEGVTVKATEYWAQGFERSSNELTTTTDANGYYSFEHVRGSSSTTESSVAGQPFDPDTYYDSPVTSLEVTVENPDTTVYCFSPTTETGTHPSVVSATDDQTSATKTSVQYSSSDSGELVATVDAGLVSSTVVYTAGEHGTFDDVVFSKIAEGSDTPSFSGVLDDLTSNAVNAGLPQGEKNWRFAGWVKQGSTSTDDGETGDSATTNEALLMKGVDETVSFGVTTYVAQWERVEQSSTSDDSTNGSSDDTVSEETVVTTDDQALLEPKAATPDMGDASATSLAALVTFGIVSLAGAVLLKQRRA